MTTKIRPSLYRNLFFSAYLILIGSGFYGLWLYRHPPTPATSGDETVKPLESQSAKDSPLFTETLEQETALPSAAPAPESADQSRTNGVLGNYFLPGIFVRENPSDENTQTTAFISE